LGFSFCTQRKIVDHDAGWGKSIQVLLKVRSSRRFRAAAQAVQKQRLAQQPIPLIDLVALLSIRLSAIGLLRQRISRSRVIK
jgi:hypothetical protein